MYEKNLSRKAKLETEQVYHRIITIPAVSGALPSRRRDPAPARSLSSSAYSALTHSQRAADSAC